MSDSEDATRDPTRCKVGRVVEVYGLDGLGAELEQRWTAPEGERESLRSLAEHVNRRLLEAALREADESPTAAELEGIYTAITGENVDGATRTRERRALERRGVDVDRLRDDFVTHQAVHTYLTEYRDATFEPEPSTLEDETATLARLRSRTAAVTDSTLARLAAADRIADRDYETLVNVRVLCRDCGRATDVGQLIEEGGCPCDADESS